MSARLSGRAALSFLAFTGAVLWAADATPTGQAPTSGTQTSNSAQTQGVPVKPDTSLHLHRTDTLPAYIPDTVVADTIRKVEAGPTPLTYGTQPAGPASPADSLARKDTVTYKLRQRHPALSFYGGVDFIDLDSKQILSNALSARLAVDTTLKVLQNYDPVHLAFPLGLQALYPLNGWFDLVAKTHSYWYKQTAVLGTKATSSHADDEWYQVQANLGGLGLRYYMPPSILSISSGLGIFAQGVLYWNLGGSEFSTPYGSAKAGFDPMGAGYELMFGVQRSLRGPWQLAGALGFLQQDLKSNSPWSSVIQYNPPSGDAHWGSSSIQLSLNMWYHFGVPSDTAKARNGSTLPAPASSTQNVYPPASPEPGPGQGPGVPDVPAPVPADSTRKK
jgi:hypothetical protein